MSYDSLLNLKLQVKSYTNGDNPSKKFHNPEKISVSLLVAKELGRFMTLLPPEASSTIG